MKYRVVKLNNPDEAYPYGVQFKVFCFWFGTDTKFRLEDSAISDIRARVLKTGKYAPKYSIVREYDKADLLVDRLKGDA